MSCWPHIFNKTIGDTRIKKKESNIIVQNSMVGKSKQRMGEKRRCVNFNIALTREIIDTM